MPRYEVVIHQTVRTAATVEVVTDDGDNAISQARSEVAKSGFKTPVSGPVVRIESLRKISDESPIELKIQQPATPNLDKLMAVKEDAERIKAFLDYLQKHSLIIARVESGQAHPAKDSGQVMYDFFGIDPAALAKEKQETEEYTRRRLEIMSAIRPQQSPQAK